jgi:hypothetical protein
VVAEQEELGAVAPSAIVREAAASTVSPISDIAKIPGLAKVCSL